MGDGVILCLGLNTGTGKPAVIPKWVSWVWVQFWFLVHCNTPCTCVAVSQVCTGKLQYGDLNFYCFLLIFFQCFFSTPQTAVDIFTVVCRGKFIMSCCDETKYGSVSLSYILACNYQHALSSHSHSHPTSETCKL